LLPVIRSLLLINRQHLPRILLRLVKLDVAGMPDEVLEQLVRVFLLDHEAGRLDDVAGVLDELLAVGGELVEVDGGVGVYIVEGFVDLGVGGHAALAECFDDAVEADLRVLGHEQDIVEKNEKDLGCMRFVVRTNDPKRDESFSSTFELDV
jgi:hypothetical protein